MTPTYKDIMVREMLEPEASTVVRNTFCSALSGSITTSHMDKKPVGEIDRDALKIEIRQKVVEALTKHLKQDVFKHKAQAPSQKDQDITIGQIASLAAEKVRDRIEDFLNENDKMWYVTTIATDQHRDIRLDTVVSTQPYKADAGEVARVALEAVYRELSPTNSLHPTAGQLKEHAIKDYLGAEDRARETFNNEQSVTALKVQTALLTSAVAEVNAKDDDRKLRIHNIDSILKTKVSSGDRNAVRESKDKRECEIVAWIDELTKAEHNFSPKFTVFIIEPKSAKQKATAFLTFALESDKYRVEKLIKKARGDDRTKPSSQRYTGPEHDAYNVPSYKDISNKILSLYQQKLAKDAAHLDTTEKKILMKKWQVDSETTLFISRKTSNNPFKVFFEFVDPTNNVTFMRYSHGTNPFAGFDFLKDIPNPATREKARTDEAYKHRYKNQARIRIFSLPEWASTN